MMQLLIAIQLSTTPMATKMPYFSWEQTKPVNPPEFKPGMPPSGSAKKVEEQEEWLYEHNAQ